MNAIVPDTPRAGGRRWPGRGSARAAGRPGGTDAAQALGTERNGPLPGRAVGDRSRFAELIGGRRSSASCSSALWDEDDTTIAALEASLSPAHTSICSTSTAEFRSGAMPEHREIIEHFRLAPEPLHHAKVLIAVTRITTMCSAAEPTARWRHGWRRLPARMLRRASIAASARRRHCGARSGQMACGRTIRTCDLPESVDTNAVRWRRCKPAAPDRSRLGRAHCLAAAGRALERRRRGADDRSVEPIVRSTSALQRRKGRRPSGSVRPASKGALRADPVCGQGLAARIRGPSRALRSRRRESAEAACQGAVGLRRRPTTCTCGCTRLSTACTRRHRGGRWSEVDRTGPRARPEEGHAPKFVS